MNLYWRSVIKFHLFLIKEIVTKKKNPPSHMVVDKTSLCSDLVDIFLLGFLNLLEVSHTVLSPQMSALELLESTGFTGF